jgi:hypothetical protein
MQFRPAGRLFGIDLAGLFNDDDEATGGLNPFLSLMQQTKGRGGALSMRPQPQTGTTAMLGFGGAGGGAINNYNYVGSNIGANTGVANINQGEVDQPVTTPDPTPTPDPSPGPEPYFTPEAVRFSRTPLDYTKDLSRQEAVGKANQLLKRAVGDKLTTQEQYNRLFDPLLKDLQEGDDYGFDIDRFYKNVEKEGFTPYKDIGVAGKLGSTSRGDSGAYADYVNTLFGRDKTFFDQKDAGRRFLEAKAFYRPGGEDTQLDKIGMIQGRFDQGEMKFRGAGGEDYGTGYRAGTVGDRLRPFYETYMKEQGLGATQNPEGYAAGSSLPENSTASQTAERFADYDFASFGEGGYGLKDVRALLDKGATSEDLLRVGKRARSQGLNVGEGVRGLFSELA